MRIRSLFSFHKPFSILFTDYQRRDRESYRLRPFLQMFYVFDVSGYVLPSQNEIINKNIEKGFEPSSLLAKVKKRDKKRALYVLFY